jgi:hypothetical protein
MLSAVAACRRMRHEVTDGWRHWSGGTRSHILRAELESDPHVGTRDTMLACVSLQPRWQITKQWCERFGFEACGRVSKELFAAVSKR